MPEARTMNMQPPSVWTACARRAVRALERVEALGETPLLTSLRQGLVQVIPLIILGALALLLLNLPGKAVAEAMDALLGQDWRTLCDFIQQGTLGAASLTVLISVSISYTRQRNRGHNGQPISTAGAAAITLSCYFIAATPLRGGMPAGFFALGGGGFPLALLVVLTAPPVFVCLMGRRWVSRRFLDGVGYDPTLQLALSTAPAWVITVLLFAVCRMALERSGLPGPAALAQGLFTMPLQGIVDQFGTGLGYVFFSQFLWYFGVHGPNLLIQAEQNILVPAALTNMDAALLGQVPPFILTKPFLDAFVHIGGSGCTLSLILAILLKGRDPSTRKLALIGILPALFNVNEVILFGIPLVLNPVYLLPFLLAPVAAFILAYAATALELVPRTIQTIHWTTPALFGGYAATGGLAGVWLQVVNIALAMSLYLPFVGLAGERRTRQRQRLLDVLLARAGSSSTSPDGKKCTGLPGLEGVLARNLANDLASALRGEGQIFLQYQPVFDVRSGQCAGGEALLRWEHPVYGPIPPLVTVTLAEDTGLIHQLGRRVLRQACRQRARYRDGMAENHAISVNMSALQFEMDGVVEMVREALREHGLQARMLKIEITESIALAPDEKSVQVLRELQNMGVRIAIDDFGMGHTSLRYLKEFPVDTVKIDRSLTQAEPNHVNDHIIQSIVGLCQALGVHIVVEGVETGEQLERFKAYGCSLFQGYLFSRPLPEDAYLDYVRRHAAGA